MLDPKANKMLDELIKSINDGINVEAIVPKLKEIREFAKKEEDPLVTKILRLMYEFLEENEAFDIEPTRPEPEEEKEEGVLEIAGAEEFEEEEEEEFVPESDEENLQYLLQLIKGSRNEINRDEIKAYRTALKDDLY